FLGLFSPSLGAAILASLAAAGLGIPLLTRALGQAPGRQLVAARAALADRLVETVQGAAEITAFGRENDWQAQIAGLDREYSRAGGRMAWIRGLQAGLSSLAANLGMLALLLLAVRLVRSGALAGTSLALVALGGLASFEAVASLPLAAQYLETSLAAARRLFAVADQVPLIQDPPHPQDLPIQNAVEFRNVSFAYPGQAGRPALRNIDLEIPPGGRVAVVGESGAGKTSLAALLLRFWDPTAGEVRLGGVDLRCLRQADLRRRVGLIAQSTALFNTSVLQNLLLANPAASREQVEEAAQRAQIHERILRLPQGYETPIGERGLRLSAGERRRISIARALLQDPALLILDEPTANLDARTGHDLLETLFTVVFPGRSVLLITHRLAFLDRVDEVLVLHRGVIVERGTHAELVAARGRYARLVELESFLLPPPEQIAPRLRLGDS
ncbi:MAG TPA: thiol reductant ABC exporter subunit CydC, partial [Anaerolineaceae bacterium]